MDEKRVFFIAYDGFSDWECAYALAELASGRYFKRDAPSCRVMTATPSGGEVRSMGGMRVVADLPLSAIDPEPDDMFLIPGGLGWEADGHGDIAALATMALGRGMTVAAICGATFGLARAGLLNSRKHTSNAPQYLSLAGPAYSGAALYRWDPVVSDVSLITATGLAPVEFAHEIFSQSGLFTKEVADAWRELNLERSFEAWNAFQAATGGAQL